VSPSFYLRWTQINPDALWSSALGRKGNKGMKHRQISSSTAAQEAVENLRFLLFRRVGQTIWRALFGWHCRPRAPFQQQHKESK
jgi:hypothetical protein